MRIVSLGGAFPIVAEGMLPSLTSLRLDDNLFTGSLPNELEVLTCPSPKLANFLKTFRAVAKFKLNILNITYIFIMSNVFRKF